MRVWIVTVLCSVAAMLGTAGRSSAAVVRCSDAGTSAVCSKQLKHSKLGNTTPFSILLGAQHVSVSGGIRLPSRPLSPSSVSIQPPSARLIHVAPQYTLAITSVPSQRVTELTPVTVGFTFEMQASPLTSSDTIYVCSAFPDANLPCYKIQAPRNNQQYVGTVQATAPWAAVHAPLHLVAFCNCWPTTGAGEFPETEYLADATKDVESAATYTLSFDGFTPKDTRSHQTDTVWLNLQGQITTTPPSPPDITTSPNACKYVGENWCLMGAFLEQAHTSHYHPVSDKQVSSFRLTPEKESDLRVLFFLYNLGHSGGYQLADSIANGFSDAGEIILGTYTGNSATAQQLNNYIQKLNGALTASCDGPLALDVQIFNNQSVDGSNLDTLDNLTRGTGAFSYSPPTVYHYKDGDAICDHRGSSYTVNLTVHRTSWRNWSELP